MVGARLQSHVRNYTFLEENAMMLNMSKIVEVVERYEVPDMPDIDLPDEDGVPLESNWHRKQIHLLLDIIYEHWSGRTDFFAGGNMFIYYDEEQAKTREFRGPDVFIVKDVDGTRDRRKWVVWLEKGRYPNVIIELLSPTTAHQDLGAKKMIYQKTFRTPEYFCYDPDSRQLQGWRLSGEEYLEIEPDQHGLLHSHQLDGRLGKWEGEYQKLSETWLRLFDDNDRLLPTAEEAERKHAEAEQQRADAEQQRADEAERRASKAEAELLRLKQQLSDRKESGSSSHE